MMTTDQIRSILAMLSGYWPTPSMSEEEVVAWTRELCGPYPIGYVEAQTVIDEQKTREWRPRPGETVSLVQGLRRREALQAERHLQLVADPDEVALTREQTLAKIAECRQTLTRSGTDS